MNIIGYLRVSTDGQTESGLGLEAQKNAIEKFALNYPDSELEIFTDEGICGAFSLDKRPELLNALNSLKKGDIFVVAKRDRLGRDPIEVGLIEREILKKAKELISLAGEGTSNNDPSSILMRRITDAFAEYERLIIKARTKAALQVKKEKGERVGYIPFGYQIAKCCTNEKEKHLEENSIEQNMLQQMKKLKANGFSIRAIAKELNQQHILNRNNNLWNNASIFRVMKNIK